jgi:hypothetical protein
MNRLMCKIRKERYGTQATEQQYGILNGSCYRASLKEEVFYVYSIVAGKQHVPVHK